jgi:cytochrome c-type biogenesis protein
MFANFQTALYQVEQFATQLVNRQLTEITGVSVGVIFAAGLLTSLTPCMLSMLPITIGYIGGYQMKSRWQAGIQSTIFALGIATTLAGLGIFAAGVGKVYGQVGVGLPMIIAVIAIIMGLNLLEALPFRLPDFGGTDWISKDLPASVRSYLLGVTFGLVASPCSTPVLAALLAWVSGTGNLLLGAVLLLSYTAGYVLPLIIAGTFTATIKQLLEVRKWSGWITPVSGVLLIGFGLFTLVSRIPKFN